MLNPPRPPRSPLFPYTTLFRSTGRRDGGGGAGLDRPGGDRARPDGGPDDRHDVLLGDLPLGVAARPVVVVHPTARDRKSTRLNSSHRCISYAVFCLKKKIKYIL